MDRVSAVVRRLAALLGGIDYDAAAAADLPPPDSMEAMEAAEHDLAFLLGILPAFDHGPDIPKALNTMESWLDDYKHILPYPVTRAIVDRMVAVALEAGDADMPTGNEMSADAIRQRYAEYFVSDSDQLDAIYEDEQESSDGGIGLGDELPEVDVDERVQSIQRRQLWKETCVREYGVTLAETIKPFLVDPVLELGCDGSVFRSITLAQMCPSVAFHAASVNGPSATTFAEPPANLHTWLAVDPTSSSFYGHGIFQQSGKEAHSLPPAFGCLLVSCIDSLRYQGTLLECVFRGAKHIVKEGGKCILWTPLTNDDAQEWRRGPKLRDEVDTRLPLIVAEDDPEGAVIAEALGRVALSPSQMADSTLLPDEQIEDEANGDDRGRIALPELVSEVIIPLAWRSYFRHLESHVVECSGFEKEGAAGSGKFSLLVMVFERDHVDSDDDVDLTVF